MTSDADAIVLLLASLLVAGLPAIAGLPAVVGLPADVGLPAGVGLPAVVAGFPAFAASLLWRLLPYCCFLL